jgi:hypothetical protein
MTIFSKERKGFLRQAQNIRSRGRRNYDDQRKLGTMGTGLFKSVRIPECKFKGTVEA